MGELIHLNSRRDRTEPWLNKRQIAAHLAVSTRWVEMRTADSGLPVHRVKGTNFYKVSEVDRWVENPLT